MPDLAPPVPWAPADWPSERPSDDPDALEIWCYTPRFSYRPGDRVDVHVHTTADRFSFAVVRDGRTPQTVLERTDVPGARGHTPDDAYATGCDWPVATSFEVGTDWRPGLYLLIVRVQRDGRAPVEREHFIVVRPAVDGSVAKTALLLTTSTLIAYNDWGGANHYRGIGNDPREPLPSPVLSIHRPVGRGFLRLPPGAPREANPQTPPPNAQPRYPSLEWARTHGYCRHYPDAFWATYERPFVVWAEGEGYELEYLTQHDIHFEPDALAAYDAVVIVGHDEYWSWEMRDAVDAFVDAGGHLARFGGNFLWQVRLSEDGAQQTNYKLPSLDPYHGDPERGHLVTTAWEFVGRPGTQTMGLTGLAGIYNRYGGAMPRSSGGFTVYRPDHWAFAGTGLEYGDLIGGTPICAAGFETDGIDFTFRYGLPYPTDKDSPPDGLELLAMAPASIGEVDRWNGQVGLNAPAREARAIFVDHFGSEEGDVQFEERRHGSAMIATFNRGAGSVFNAGGTDWVNGLALRDPFIEQITRNALNHRHQKAAS
jgi:hypothetical protein